MDRTHPGPSDVLRHHLNAEEWGDLVRILTSEGCFWSELEPELAIECWLAIERAGFATMEESFRAAWARWNGDEGPDVGQWKSPDDLLALGHRMVDLLKFAGRIGDPAPAIQRRVVELAREIFGDERITARALNALGSLYEGSGEWSKAEALYLEALAIFEATVGSEDIGTDTDIGTDIGTDTDVDIVTDTDADIDTAITLNNLSNLWIDLGRIEEATEAHERYAQIWDRLHGPDDPARVTCLNRAAMIRQENEDLGGALALARAAWDLAGRVLPEHDPDWLTSCSNLGALLVMSGERDEARGYLEKMLESTERFFGPAHPKTATALYNVASLMLELEESEGALARFRRARAILMTMAPNHVDLVSIEEQISFLLLMGQDFEGAAEHLERSLAIREEWMGEDHPDHCHALEFLAPIYQALGESQKALATELRLERIKRLAGESWEEEEE
jgi:tetratricopeptide (TPR) repeat protein